MIRERKRRLYVLSVSILLNVIVVWESFCVLMIWKLHLNVNLQSPYLYAVTSAALLVISLMTVVYFYQNNFSEVFFAKAVQLTAEEAMDRIMETYHLTRRERDVLDLVHLVSQYRSQDPD